MFPFCSSQARSIFLLEPAGALPMSFVEGTMEETEQKNEPAAPATVLGCLLNLILINLVILICGLITPFFYIYYYLLGGREKLEKSASESDR